MQQIVKYIQSTYVYAAFKLLIVINPWRWPNHKLLPISTVEIEPAGMKGAPPYVW